MAYAFANLYDLQGYVAQLSQSLANAGLKVPDVPDNKWGDKYPDGPPEPPWEREDFRL